MKVLEVNVDDLGMGGVYSLVRNIVVNQSGEHKIDIACYEPFENPKNVEELAAHNCEIKYFGSTKGKLDKVLGSFKRLAAIVRDGGYDVVHIHSDLANKLLQMAVAVRMGSKTCKVIVHSHASAIDGNQYGLRRLAHTLSRPFLKYVATDFASCSDLASAWMFPNIAKERIVMINNGIDLSKFRFSDAIRSAEREKLGLAEKYIIGHVGRFAYQKNHEYLLKAFAAYHRTDKDAVLLLIGEGPLLAETKQQAKELGIEDAVVFYGTSKNVSALMQAMDVFVLPSRFEGLPIVGVEAQAAGLPVIFSTEITHEAKLTENCSYLPISEKAIAEWAEKLKQTKTSERKNNFEQMRKCGFSIEATVEAIERLYKNTERIVAL